jgi:hypothetical protein
MRRTENTSVVGLRFGNIPDKRGDRTSGFFKFPIIRLHRSYATDSRIGDAFLQQKQQGGRYRRPPDGQGRGPSATPPRKPSTSAARRSHLCRTSHTLDVLGRSALGGSGESNVLSCACWQLTRSGTRFCCAQASGTRSVIPTDNATILALQLRKYESGRVEAVPSLPH